MDLEQALAGPQGQANGHVITAHLRWRGCEGAHTGSEAPRAQGRGEGWRSPWTSSPADAELGGGAPAEEIVLPLTISQPRPLPWHLKISFSFPTFREWETFC